MRDAKLGHRHVHERRKQAVQVSLRHVKSLGTDLTTTSDAATNDPSAFSSLASRCDTVTSGLPFAKAFASTVLLLAECD